MARRRRPNYYNPNWKDGLTAAEINARDSEGNLIDPDRDVKYNRLAAEQSMAIRESNGEIAGSFPTLHAKMLAGEDDDLVAAKKYQQQKDYQALAGALGVDAAPKKDIWDEARQRYVRPVAAPGMETLKGVFASLPSNEQAKIYMRGKAPHIDAESGFKLLSGLQKTREESLNSGISAMVGQLARGDVFNDPVDGLFYRTVTETDPVTGTSKKTKAKITPLEAKYLYEGRERGMIPDWSGLKGPPPVPVTAAVDPLARTSLVPTKTDPFVNAHNMVSTGEASRYAGDLMGDVGIAMADTATGVANGYLRARNAASRLMFGEGANQRSLIPKLSAQRPDDPMWVATQAEMARQAAEDRARAQAANPIAIGF